ncbi:unnamed protein product [Onchocerca flexuosa]|uniref:HMG box domain-containing protein n=1 Tax=Onchocerca flexuosa TaxID=387005 RepID=A0A183HBV1_9BILA|nr:unnamed protein product [Onchocerca flexuosa]
MGSIFCCMVKCLVSLYYVERIDQRCIECSPLLTNPPIISLLLATATGHSNRVYTGQRWPHFPLFIKHEIHGFFSPRLIVILHETAFFRRDRQLFSFLLVVQLTILIMAKTGSKASKKSGKRSSGASTSKHKKTKKVKATFYRILEIFLQDPNAPKRAKSAYMFWLSENRSRIAKPGMSVIDVSKAAGIEWGKIKDKSKYEKMASQDKQRYEAVSFLFFLSRIYLVFITLS